MYPSAFAAERRAAAPLLLDARRSLSIDVFCQRDAFQQTRRKLLLLSNDGTDRQTLNLFIDSAPAPRSKTLVCVLTVRLEYRPVKSTMLSVSEIQISKFGT